MSSAYLNELPGQITQLNLDRGVILAFQFAQNDTSTHDRLKEFVMECYEEFEDETLEVVKQSIGAVLTLDKKSAAIDYMKDFTISIICNMSNDDSARQRAVTECMTYLSDAVLHDSKAVRINACNILREVMSHLPDDYDLGEQVLDSLFNNAFEKLKDKVASVREAAVKVFDRFRDDEQVQAEFIKMLQTDPASEVRIAVIKTIICSKDTYPHILSRVRDLDPAVRKAAVATLGNIRAKSKVVSSELKASVIAQALGDRDSKVAQEAATVLSTWLSSSNTNAVSLTDLVDSLNPHKNYTECERIVAHILASHNLTVGGLKFNAKQGLPVYNKGGNGGSVKPVTIGFPSLREPLHASLDARIKAVDDKQPFTLSQALLMRVMLDASSGSAIAGYSVGSKLVNEDVFEAVLPDVSELTNAIAYYIDDAALHREMLLMCKHTDTSNVVMMPILRDYLLDLLETTTVADSSVPLIVQTLRLSIPVDPSDPSFTSWINSAMTKMVNKRKGTNVQTIERLTNTNAVVTILRSVIEVIQNHRVTTSEVTQRTEIRAEVETLETQRVAIYSGMASKKYSAVQLASALANHKDYSRLTTELVELRQQYATCCENEDWSWRRLLLIVRELFKYTRDMIDTQQQDEAHIYLNDLIAKVIIPAFDIDFWSVDIQILAIETLALSALSLNTFNIVKAMVTMLHEYAVPSRPSAFLHPKVRLAAVRALLDILVTFEGFIPVDDPDTEVEVLTNYRLVMSTLTNLIRKDYITENDSLNRNLKLVRDRIFVSYGGKVVKTSSKYIDDNDDDDLEVVDTDQVKNVITQGDGVYISPCGDYVDPAITKILDSTTKLSSLDQSQLSLEQTVVTGLCKLLLYDRLPATDTVDIIAKLLCHAVSIETDPVCKQILFVFFPAYAGARAVDAKDTTDRFSTPLVSDNVVDFDVDVFNFADESNSWFLSSRLNVADHVSILASAATPAVLYVLDPSVVVSIDLAYKVVSIIQLVSSLITTREEAGRASRLVSHSAYAPLSSSVSPLVKMIVDLLSLLQHIPKGASDIALAVTRALGVIGVNSTGDFYPFFTYDDANVVLTRKPTASNNNNNNMDSLAVNSNIDLNNVYNHSTASERANLGMAIIIDTARVTVQETSDNNALQRAVAVLYAIYKNFAMSNGKEKVNAEGGLAVIVQESYTFNEEVAAFMTSIASQRNQTVVNCIDKAVDEIWEVADANRDTHSVSMPVSKIPQIPFEAIAKLESSTNASDAVNDPMVRLDPTPVKKTTTRTTKSRKAQLPVVDEEDEEEEEEEKPVKAKRNTRKPKA